MSATEQSVIINRPVEEVWKFISNIENAPKWDRGVLAGHQISKGPPGVGTTFADDAPNARHTPDAQVHGFGV
jgi:hypothetical protein